MALYMLYGMYSMYSETLSQEGLYFREGLTTAIPKTMFNSYSLHCFF
jgi:hypothetical protein